MLIEFNVKNYLSFKEKTSLSMLAHSMKEFRSSNVFDVKNVSLLKSAAIYGSNASGKTNLSKAFLIYKELILNSAKDSNANEEIPVEVFRLNSSTESKPSLFEAFFIIDKTVYQYGFETTKDRIEKEWLYSFPNNKQRSLFERKKDKIKVQPKYFKEGKKSLIPMTRSNSLFLSVCAQWNGEISKSIQEWMLTFNVIYGYREDLIGLSVHFLGKDGYIDTVSDFLKHADLGIKDFLIQTKKYTIEQLPIDMPDNLKKVAVEKGISQFHTVHNKYDAKKKVIGTEIFDLDKNESHGTQKMFALAGPILETLKNGGKLFVDEIDSSLHSELVVFLIKLFNSKKNNPKNAQLIFTTHDTGLLDRGELRRDQIWFFEKNNFQESELCSLLEFKPRNDASLEKNYAKGRYGARPHIGEYNLTKK